MREKDVEHKQDKGCPGWDSLSADEGDIVIFYALTCPFR